ncbi:hypothetical protein CSKR_203919 [Clonorchis sinensis]|uniref:Uncharacterized protein n=1 Tax=Clonorchis sinensis TaxID=79923 RepID=A0A8T1MDN9_CLOSI|nr:hypothetical protein CSKR_203919 [Clonorchis sinensis]
MCCICVPCWRFAVCCDDWLQMHLKVYHPNVFECVVRSIMPAMASARTVCACLTYFCLICPVEFYRCYTCRDPLAYHKCMLDFWCVLCQQLDMFDMEEMGVIPQWKQYMQTGEWPWGEDSEEEDGEDEDEDDDDDDDEDEEDDDES